MPRVSTNPDKPLYTIVRERLGLSREKASDCIKCITADRLEKIENGRVIARPDEILAMAKAYCAPAIINFYCTHDCDIGEKCINEVKPKELTQIAIETLNSLNKLNQMRDRLLEIVEDGTITEDEYVDFQEIKNNLDKIAHAVESLQLWLDESLATEKVKSEIVSR